MDAQLAAVEAAWTHAGDIAPSDRETLRAFTGWGQLAPAFAACPEGKWAAVADRLEDAVPAAALNIAREQVDTSFFTPAAITGAVYRLLASTGFTGGRVLEPGCGAGAFMGAAPAEWDIEWTGVELDPTSARIAALLNPGADIRTGKLETTVLADGHFDAVVGNVPFSDVRVHDREGRHASLHNYFVLRAMEAVRPGGYVILVTSRHTMDSRNGIESRIHDIDGAAFIGAARLPSGAFAEAGTDAVTDIVVVRKNDAEHTQKPWAFPPSLEVTRSSYYGQDVADRRPRITAPVTAGTQVRDAPQVSRYWEVHPEHVAGTMLATGFDRAPLTVRSADAAADIDRAVTALAVTLPPLGEREAAMDMSLDDVVLEDAEGRKEGSFHVIDGVTYRVARGALEQVRTSKELTALVALRELAVDLLAAETDLSRSDMSIVTLRAETWDAYEVYVAKFGRLNRGTLVEGAVDEETGLPALSWRRPSMGGFRRDPDAPLVMALEVFDQDTGEAGPAPILLHRVNRRPDPIERVDTAEEAVAVSLGESGRIDLERIAGLLGLTGPSAAVAALGELVFEDSGVWVPAAEYLSGNVRQKLAAARAAGNERNIAALEKVVPADLGPLDIAINLGSPFLRTSDIEAFLREELGIGWPSVAHLADPAVWEVGEADSSAAAQLTYGTADIKPWKLVEYGLNARMPEVNDRVWVASRRTNVSRKNMEKTAAAAEKLELIRDRFSVWVWEDKGRSDRICAEYNQKLNAHVPRVYDGSGLTFPGLARDFTPWAHQRAAVERIVSSPRALLAHSVGSGKTAEMILSARTLRQFGLARKPLIIVPNHLLEQIAREAQQLFPAGRFLIASKDDLARGARRLFAARCATGEWDAVIMTHSSFSMVPVSPDSESDWLFEQKMDLRMALQTANSGRKEAGPKAIARAIRALEARMGKLRSGVADEDAIFFEQLGVDYIMVDEAHCFRRLGTGSSNRDNGLGGGASKRATDLLVKVETLARRRPEGAPVAAFFTGTPWSNTLAETWVWQRFLQPDTLRAMDLLPFDAWVSAFIRFETAVEVAPDGSGFRLQRRPVGVVNVPELKTLLSQVADILDPASLGIARPDHTVETVVVDPTPEQHAFVRDLAQRADAIRNKTADRREKRDGGETDDSMLLVCNDGRKVALDPRLVGIDEHSAKLSELAARIAKTYHANKDRTFGSHPVPGGFQLAFLDLGTPKPGESSTYGRLRRAVVERGVPAHMVRFVHDATTDKARAALFSACRDGEVALLIASTAKAGMGTNVQTRLTHLWHGDAPWLPSDVIQRDGRAVRPGNLAGHVTITRIVTEGTFDAFMWQALERKSRAFDVLYAAGMTAREIEDVSAATMSYAEVKALASGNPLLLDQAKTAAEVKRLRLMRSVHFQSAREAEATARRCDESATALRRSAEHAEAALVKLAPAATDDERGALRGAIETAGRYPTIRVRWRGLDLRGYATKGRFAGVRVQNDYVTVESVELTPREVRRTAVTLTELLAERVDAMLDDLPRAVASWRARADALSAQAHDARVAAQSASFPDEDRLTAAVAELARIDALIQAQAEESQHVLAA